MEQYLLQVPRTLADEIRKAIASGDSDKIELISAADNKHFTFKQGGREYFAKIAQLPCILETHKTYDDNLFYKSGEIGQIFIVTDNEEEIKEVEECNEVPNGITPPTTNIVKRTFEKTKSHTPYPKNEVARVEESLIKISQGGTYEDVHEEVVDFCDWMIDEEHPNGVVFTDEMELIRLHPEYLDLSTKANGTEFNATEGSNGNSSLSMKNGISNSLRMGSYFKESSSLSTSALNTPLDTPMPSEPEDFGSASAPASPSLSISQDVNDDIDDLENDLMGDLTSSTSGHATKENKNNYQQDPLYQRLLPIRKKLEESIAEKDREIADFNVQVNSNSNIVVKNRFKQMLEAAETQRQVVVDELNKIKAEIRAFEES